MFESSYNVYLQCCACENVEFADTHALAARLRKLGMFRRDADPPSELVKEMVSRMADAFSCSTCQNVGLTVTDKDPFDDEDWGQGRKCESCRALIPPERLEIFPDTRLCMACKSADESGATDEGEADYCPRCGDIRHLRQRGGTGVAGYKMFCPTCGR